MLAYICSKMSLSRDVLLTLSETRNPPTLFPSDCHTVVKVYVDEPYYDLSIKRKIEILFAGKLRIVIKDPELIQQITKSMDKIV